MKSFLDMKLEYRIVISNRAGAFKIGRSRLQSQSTGSETVGRVFKCLSIILTCPVKSHGCLGDLLYLKISHQ